MNTPIITVTEYQKIMGLPIKEDDRAEFLIQLTTDQVVDICNNPFSDGYPEPLKLTCAKMVYYTANHGRSEGLQSVSQGGLSYTYKNGDYANMLTELNRYKIAKVKRASIQPMYPKELRGRL